MPTAKMIKSGIMMRLAFSMPFSTPMATTRTVTPVKIPAHANDSTGLVINDENALAGSAASSAPPPRTYVAAYFVTQPPITQ